MVVVGKGISVSAITENSVEIVEGGSSRWHENRVSRFIFSTEAVLIQTELLKVKGYKVNNKETSSQ